MLLVLAALAFGVVAVVVANEIACRANNRQRLQQRTREAEHEISGISQCTQDAIVAELLRRSEQQRRVVEGEVVSVRDEPVDPYRR